MPNYDISIESSDSLSRNTKLDGEFAGSAGTDDIGRQTPWPMGAASAENEWKEIPLLHADLNEVMTLFASMRAGANVDAVFTAIDNL